MKKFLLLLSFLVNALLADAQYLKSSNQAIDLAFSSNGSQTALSLGWSHLHGLGKKKNFRIGYGIRYSQNFGSNTTFVTAPAELTSGQTGLGVLFSDYIPENFDTLTFSKYSVGSFNLSIHLNYRIKTKWEVEFNIDADGVSFGKKQDTKYESNKNTNFGEVQPASPTSLNLLLTSDNDIGSLNSELMARYWFKPTWSIKAGATFIFAEYTTNNKLYLDNDRFRNKALMGMIGISYNPFRGIGL